MSDTSPDPLDNLFGATPEPTASTPIDPGMTQFFEETIGELQRQIQDLTAGMVRIAERVDKVETQTEQLMALPSAEADAVAEREGREEAQRTEQLERARAAAAAHRERMEALAAERAEREAHEREEAQRAEQLETAIAALAGGSALSAEQQELLVAEGVLSADDLPGDAEEVSVEVIEAEVVDVVDPAPDDADQSPTAAQDEVAAPSNAPPPDDDPFAPAEEGEMLPPSDDPFAPTGEGEMLPPPPSDDPFAPTGEGEMLPPPPSDDPFAPTGEGDMPPPSDDPFAPMGESETVTPPPPTDDPFAPAEVAELSTSSADDSANEGEMLPPPPSDDPFAPAEVAELPPPSDDPFAPAEVAELPPPSDDPFAPAEVAELPPPSDDPFAPAAMPPPGDDPLAAAHVTEMPPPAEATSAPAAAAPAYVPAYASNDDDFSHILPDAAGAGGAATSGAAIRALPVDLVWAVGVRDSAANSENLAALQEIREKARVERNTKRKGGKKSERVATRPLPFHTIQRGRPMIVAIASPKGGVGKSTTSVNLGAYIAEVGRVMVEDPRSGLTEPPRVLVMDGDIANGNLAIRVAQKLRPDMLDLIEAMDHNQGPQVYASDSQPAMRQFILWHEDLPNLNILAAPENPEIFFDFTVDDYERVMALLGQFYDVIIIDCGTELVMESNRTWLRHANRIFLLTVPEIASLRSAGKYADLITRAAKDGRPPLVSFDKLNIVMMRADADLGFDPQFGVEHTFSWATKDRVFYFPDFDKEATQAANRGELLVLENPDFCKEIGALATAAFQQYGTTAGPGPVSSVGR